MASFFVLWLVFVLHASSASEAPCNLESSLRERTLLIGRGLLNKLGMENPPAPPTSRNVSEGRKADFRAVQALGTMRQAEEKSPCFDRNPFSTTNYATFPTRAISLPYSVLNYYDPYGLFGKKKRQVHPQSSPVPPFSYQFTFPINTTSEGREFFSSELILFRKVSQRGRHLLKNFETIQLNYIVTFRRLYKGFIWTETRRQQHIETRVVDATTDGYIRFNTTHSVFKWQEMNPMQSAGFITFEIKILTPTRTDTGKPLSPAIEFSTTERESSQFVMNFARPENIPDVSRSTRRAKRQSEIPSSTIPQLDTSFCFPRPTEPNCCVRTLTINFVQDLGPDYSFILFPAEYDSNYCTGLCPNFWPSASNSTIFLQGFKQRNPTFATQPCCSPEDLGPLSMMYFSDGELEIAEVEDMIITSCICR